VPKFLENKLEAEAGKKGFTGKRKARYVYGTLNNLGAMRGSEVTKKGLAMERKHRADQRKRRKKAEHMLGKGAEPADR